MSSYSANEVKSGAFIIASLTLLLALTFVIGNFVSANTRTWQVEFGYVGGLKQNAPVYYAGREVGKVGAIEVLYGKERPILVTVKLDEKIDLREDSEVNVDTLGMMGEKMVEITPGSASVSTLATSTIIKGTDPIPMYLLIQKMNLLADRMDDLTTSLNPILESMDGILDKSEEDIHKIIANIEVTSANVRDMTRDLKFRPWRLLRKG